MQTLEKEYGLVSIPSIRVHVVVTVPAIWSDVAIRRTVEALKRAWGTDSKRHPWRVSTLTEPEAAAIYVLQQMPKHEPPTYEMKEKDCIMVVDAGGGTVDLITYRIHSLTPLRIEEAVPGAGGACGGAFLDERFEQLMVATLSQEEGFDERILQRAIRKWESVCDISSHCVVLIYSNVP